MNDKEKELWRVIDNVIKCCAIELPNGELSITREDVLGKSKAENLVMTRCMVVEQMIHAGFSITTIATVLNRTVPAVRHLCKMAYTYLSTSRVYRLATAQATLLNKGEELLAALNPAIKEKQETEKRFKALEGDISGIRGMVKQLLDKLG